MKSSIFVFLLAFSQLECFERAFLNITGNENRDVDNSVENRTYFLDMVDNDQDAQYFVASSNLRIWEEHRVPFRLSPNFSIKQILTILLALKEIQTKTCVSFTLQENETDYINFKHLGHHGSCSSHLGRLGNKQDVNFTSECINRNVVLHEMFHVLGFDHEHNRPDRDEYIQLNWSKVLPKERHKFKKFNNTKMFHFKFPYDYKSISHYHEYAYTSYLDEKTILSKKVWGIIKADGLSYFDVRKINLLYNCTKHIPDAKEFSKIFAEDFKIVDALFLESDERSNMTRFIRLIDPTMITKSPSQLAAEVRQGNVNLILPVQILGSSENNMSLLHMAAHQGNLDSVLLLLNFGANTEIKDRFGKTPLHYAASIGDEKIVSALHSHEANVEAKDKTRMTPLHHAVEKGHRDTVLVLLNSGAFIEAKDNTSRTPLLIAVEFKHRDIVLLLLNNSADIEARNDRGETALHRAIFKGYSDIVSLLLNKSANIEARATNFKFTPLHYATMGSQKTSVALLLQRGADMFAVASLPFDITNGKLTPFTIARINNETEIFDMFVKHKNDNVIQKY